MSFAKPFVRLVIEVAPVHDVLICRIETAERMEQRRPAFRVLYEAARRKSGGYLRQFGHRSGPLLSVPIRRRIAGDSRQPLAELIGVPEAGAVRVRTRKNFLREVI